MITAVDTSVLLDVFGADPTYGPHSKEVLRTCIQQGGLVACELVWSEVAAAFPFPTEAQAAMERLGVALSPLSLEAALEAGRAWKLYRATGGTGEHMVGDFLVGAHALRQADRLLARDRGFYRMAFPGLALLDPRG